MKHCRTLTFLIFLCLEFSAPAQKQTATPEQLAKWLKRFPQADTNKDGTLTLAEAKAFRDKMTGNRGRAGGGAKRSFEVNPGWHAERFPDHAVCYKTPAEIAEIYGQPIESHPKPEDGSLRIVGTGHSFMMPGYRTMPKIAEAAGFAKHVQFTHTSGGMTGSTRYKWEQENGIFQFDKKPTPKLLAGISNAEWDVMTWGPYFQDDPKYYVCWIDFCLKHNPDMKFYLSDSWPQLFQLDEIPQSEDFFTDEVLDQMAKEKRDQGIGMVNQLREKYGVRIFILPTSDAMWLAAKAQRRGELPGVEGLHRVVGKKERSLWKDTLGHLGPGFDRLEGYVFYATLYQKSPAEISGDIAFSDAEKDFPSAALDAKFREIAWQAVKGHPLSGVGKVEKKNPAP